jgi:hypothetical protein
MSLKVRKLECVELREVWKDDAHNFIPWLENSVGLASLRLLDLRVCLSQRIERDNHGATA